MDRMCLEDHSGFFLLEGVSSGINLIWSYYRTGTKASSRQQSSTSLSHTVCKAAFLL